MRGALLCCLLSLPALAWEPDSPAAVQKRITELTQAWAGKTADQIAQDKVARSRQKQPAWVAKGAWKMELRPVTYYFAVGKAGSAAAAGAGKGAGPSAPSGAPAPASSSAPAPGRPLDW